MLNRLFPFLRWFHKYTSYEFRIDFIAGLNVALVLVPQSMAYAQLAGLPVYYGLYAAFLPPMIAALFGSSNQLATGPVAIVSLMTATALEPIAVQGSEGYIAYAVLLALLVGFVQLFLGIMRLGVLVNILSHPVVLGFTNAAAIIIATSQLSKLFGVDVDKAEYHYQTIIRVVKAALVSTHFLTLLMAVFAISIMIGIRRYIPKIPNVLAAVVVTTLISWFIGFEKNEYVNLSSIQSGKVIEEITEYNKVIAMIDEYSLKRAELSAAIPKAEKEFGKRSENAIDLHHEMNLTEADLAEEKELSSLHRKRMRGYRFVKSDGEQPVFYLLEDAPDDLKGKSKWWIKVKNKKLDTEAICLAGGGVVVGHIPPGLPSLKVPRLDFSAMFQLLPIAAVISLLGFMEAISIAKAIAARTGQRLDPNQELIGQGLANIVGSFGQSYAVSGSFSRSAVNIQAGARTGMSSVFTSCIVVVVLLVLTPLLYHLPQAVLASIIMMAVINLVNFSAVARAWRTQKMDGVISIITFICTLAMAPHLEKGIALGVFLSLAVFFIQHMRPRLAVLAKHPDGRSYRDADRWGLKKCRNILCVRFNGSLFFADATYLEDQILELAGKMPKLRHVLIVGNAINEMDASGEEALESLIEKLHDAGYEVSFSGLNDPIIDIMKRTGLYDKIGDDHMFRNVRYALYVIHEKAHLDTDEVECPLMNVCYRTEPVAKKYGKGAFFKQLAKKPQQ